MAAPSQEEPGNAQLTLYCLHQKWRTTLPKVHHKELRELWSDAAQEEQFRHCLASLVGSYPTQDKSSRPINATVGEGWRSALARHLGAGAPAWL